MQLTLFFASILGILSAAPPATAFGTINGWGQHAEHGNITRLAIGCQSRAAPLCFEPRTLTAFTGRDEGGGVLGSADLTLKALQNSAHCDGGDFLAVAGYPRSEFDGRATLVACRNWIDTSLNRAVVQAGALLDKSGHLHANALRLACGSGFFFHGGVKCRILQQFGFALHAAQDFYAHTNWVDRPDPRRPIGLTNPPGLGHTGPAPWLSLRQRPAFPRGLISGCFVGEPEAWFCNDPPTGRIKHMNLNKDEGDINRRSPGGTTVRGGVQGNFGRAVDAAIMDTQDKWSLFQARLVTAYGPRQGALLACAIAHDNPLRDC